MTKLAGFGRRLCIDLLCGALLLAITAAMPVAAQDLRLPLRQGQSDLALFALSRSEAEISGLGRFLLERQGFLHPKGQEGLRQLTAGRSLSPRLRYDPNVNDGIPSDRLVLGGLPFVVTEGSRARGAPLAGLQYTGWQSWSYAPGARLRVTHGLGAEIEPTHGYHHASAHLRLCAEQPVAGWTWADACLFTGAEYDGRKTETMLGATLGARHLFRTGAGFHQAAVSFGSTATEGYGKEVAQLSHTLLTEGAGMWSLSYVWGERIEGENTLRRRLSLDWTGELAGRVVTLSLAETRTGGSTLFGIPRSDRKLRAGLTVPVGGVDLGLWVERSRSTIDAYEGVDAGVAVSFRMNLL